MFMKKTAFEKRRFSVFYNRKNPPLFLPRAGEPARHFFVFPHGEKRAVDKRRANVYNDR